LCSVEGLFTDYGKEAFKLGRLQRVLVCCKNSETKVEDLGDIALGPHLVVSR